MKTTILFSFPVLAALLGAPLSADALWDTAAAKAIAAENLVAGERRTESETLKKDGSIQRTSVELVRATLVDGRVEYEETRLSPARKDTGRAASADKKQRGAGARDLLEGGGLSPFAYPETLTVGKPGPEEVMNGEKARRYPVSWTGDGGYAFSGELLISVDRAIPVRADYRLVKSPLGSEIRKLSASVLFGEFEGLPVKTIQKMQAEAVVMLVVGVDFRATTTYSLYFDPRKEAR